MNALVNREHETEPRASLRLGEAERVALRAHAAALMSAGRPRAGQP